MAKTTKKSAAKKSTPAKNKSTAKSASKSASSKASTKSAGKSASSAKVSKVNAKNKSSENDLIQLILEDHKALKTLIKTLKDSEVELSERQDAFEEFAPLLVTHAKPEEETLYVAMKQDEIDMREDGFEGDVEHAIADQLLEEIKRTDDEDLWSARVKVLAELVEHHIEEEEEEMLPDFRKETELEERVTLGEKFRQLKMKYEALGGKDTVRESTMDSRQQR